MVKQKGKNEHIPVRFCFLLYFFCNQLRGFYYRWYLNCALFFGLHCLFQVCEISVIEGVPN
ncbi:hypothetical protein bcgnr5378_35400 [Bacillus cereus]